MFRTFIYPTGLRYIYAAAFLGCMGFAFGLYLFMQLSFGLAIFLVYFFRNPQRVVLKCSKKQILSPADGVVIKTLDNVKAPAGYEDIDCKWQQVSIFMRVSDVHLNRAPISGIVKKVIYTAGSFKYAAAAQADTDNERLSILIEGDFPLICQQVAGMLARRIICNVNVDEEVNAGQPYGFIQLGSRADLFFPADMKICVKKGDKIKAGLNYIVK